MNSVDTLGYCKRLEAVGVLREQAEVHAQMLTEVMSQVATKHDLKELEAATKHDLKKLEAATKSDLKELEIATKRNLTELEVATKRNLTELEVATKNDFKELEAATKKNLKELEIATKSALMELEVRLKEWVALYVKEQVAQLKSDILKWFFGISIAQASLIIAALRYLPH